jgi:hypothetical protein
VLLGSKPSHPLGEADDSFFPPKVKGAGVHYEFIREEDGVRVEGAG